MEREQSARLKLIPVLLVLSLLFLGHPGGTATASGIPQGIASGSAIPQGDWQWQNTFPTTNTLYGIWGAGSNNVFAVGENGTIIHYNGNSWSPMNSGTTNHLYGIWGKSINSIFVVGDKGTILYYNGYGWYPMNSGTTNTLRAVWGWNSSYVLAIGDNFTILLFDGNVWTSISSGGTSCLTGIWGSGPNDIFIVGYGTGVWIPWNSATLERQQLDRHGNGQSARYSCCMGERVKQCLRRGREHRFTLQW